MVLRRCFHRLLVLLVDGVVGRSGVVGLFSHFVIDVGLRLFFSGMVGHCGGDLEDEIGVLMS